jgi:hypothetical protein
MGQPLAFGMIPRSTCGSTRKERKESKQTAQHMAPGGLSGLAVRTVRDEPRGLSDLLSRTIRADVADRPALPADRPLNHTERTKATHEPRTVHGEHADRPPSTRGLSAQHHGPSETPSNQKPKSRRIKTKDEQEHEEHGTNPSRADRPPGPRGPSARCGQS